MFIILLWYSHSGGLRFLHYVSVLIRTTWQTHAKWLRWAAMTFSSFSWQRDRPVLALRTRESTIPVVLIKASFPGGDNSVSLKDCCNWVLMRVERRGKLDVWPVSGGRASLVQVPTAFCVLKYLAIYYVWKSNLLLLPGPVGYLLLNSLDCQAPSLFAGWEPPTTAHLWSQSHVWPWRRKDTSRANDQTCCQSLMENRWLRSSGTTAGLSSWCRRETKTHKLSNCTVRHIHTTARTWWFLHIYLYIYTQWGCGVQLRIDSLELACFICI